MSFASWRQLKNSIAYAWRGLRYALKHEQNFRLEVLVAIAVILLGIFLRLSNVRFIVLLMLITLVLVLELLNTFFERMVDFVSPRVHGYAAMLKDVLAAAVLMASVGAVAIGILIFWPNVVGSV